MHSRSPGGGSSRRERKQRTRQALLEAALELLDQESFASLSLRQVARAAGVVPTAFYRHFDSMEDLGLALIGESFRSLRAVLRDARSDPSTGGQVIHGSVALLVRHVRAHRSHFRFIARERYGGVAVLRREIRREIRLVASELAVDLGRFPYLDRWPPEDLRLLAGLIVNAMVSVAEEILDAPPGDAAAEQEIIATAEAQLRMILTGVAHWRTGDASPPPAR